MDRNALHLIDISFAYDGNPVEILSNLTISIPRGWTGLVGANGTGKTTLVGLIAGRLRPLRGTVSAPDPIVVLEQRTDIPPDDLAELTWDADAETGRIRSILGVGDDWPWRWETLSHGERKRAQVACALYRRPAVLLLDEPGNHLDRESRSLIVEALARFDGIGLLVSHDREMLDELCTACLFFRAPDRIRLRPGGVTAGLQEEERERISAERAVDRARREESRIAAEYERRRREAAKQDAKRSRRGLDRHDSDGRARIGLAIFTGKDGRAGRLQDQMDGRRRSAADLRGGAERRLSDTSATPVVKTGVTVAGTASRSDAILRTAATTIPLGDRRRLVVPELTVGPTDRVGITGPNGAGKSTLVRHLVNAFAHDHPGEPATHGVTYIPQETTRREGREILARCLALPRADQGEVLSLFSRLGSDPDRLRDSGTPSPGETRKLQLALALRGTSTALVLDEPTNHLDLDSVLLLEEALEGFPGALLLVSHDERFLNRLSTVGWRFSTETNGDSTVLPER